MEALLNYAKLAGPILSGLSLLIGLLYFIQNTNRDRIKQTLDYWEKINQELKVEKRELLKDYGDLVSIEMANLILEDKDEQSRINKVLNVYERLALGINTKAYDLKTLNKLTGQNIIDNFVRFENYIEARRKKLNRPFAWHEFQTLKEKIENLRS